MSTFPWKTVAYLLTGGTVIAGGASIPALIKYSEEIKEHTVTKTRHSTSTCSKGKITTVTETSIETNTRMGEDTQSVVTRQEKTETEDGECKEVELSS